MEQVPFERKERIQRALTDYLLPGLVAVFSKLASDDLLLVYVRQPPGRCPPQRRAIAVDELPDADLSGYDGPTLGLAAVDLIRSDIATKGPYFVRLDRVLRQWGKVELLRQTWAELASYLGQNLDRMPADRYGPAPRQRATAEIAAITAPARIAAMPAHRRRGLVAFAPDGNLAICLGDAPLDELSRIAAPAAGQIVALEEIRPLLAPPGEGAAGASPYPIELRTILHRGNLDDQLPDTLRELAAQFHERWQRTGALADRERAYAVALELRLAQGDVDDLIAVLPDPDFGTFLASGAGTYVYRRPLEGGRSRSTEGIRRRFLDDARDELVRSGSPVAFSLLPLRSLLGADRPDPDRPHWSDLGPVLRKSGRTEILARNAWLLVQDFLESPRDRRLRFAVSAESLLETMAHCCAIFSLTDPWRTRQGRRNEWLLESYRTLHRVLQILIQTNDGSRRSCYVALDHWYGCALRDGAAVSTSLELMVAALSGQAGQAAPDGELAEVAGFLREIGQALLELFRGGGRAEAYQHLIRQESESIPQVVSRATDMAQPIELLSVPFVASFQHYAGVEDTVRRTRAAQIPVRDKIERLRACAEQLLRGRRLIFAPYHQARVLDLLYARAINETQDLVHRLQGGASLEVELRTQSVAPHDRDSGIVFSVANAGSVPARDVEVELAVSDAFELLDQSYKQAMPQLAPEAQRRFRFAVRVLTAEETFPVRCTVSCRDTGPGRQSRTLEFILRVTGPDRGPFHKQPNPYVFGLPLEEHRQFYGRRSELEQLLGHLAIRRPQNVLLRGARRTGKTSLLNMVRSVLTDTDGRSGVRRWFELPDGWHSALDATVPVFLNLQGIDWPGGTPTATGFYHAVLAALRDAGLRSGGSDRLLAEPSVTFTQFVGVLRAVVRAAAVRPVLLVDEFDVLDKIAEKSFFYGPLRSAISSVQGVTWIVASALGLYHEVRAYESPLFNVFKIINLGLLDPDAARRLVLSPWEQDRDERDGSPLRFADDAVEAILEEAGHYPYFVQLLCSEIVDHVNRTRTGYVQYKTVLHVIERNMLTEGSAASEHFAYLWDRAGGVGKLILLALLRHPGAMSRDELREAIVGLLGRDAPDVPTAQARAALEVFDDSMQRLVVVDAVRRAPGGGYSFGIPIFRRLLLRRNEQEDLEQAAHEELAAEQVAGTGQAPDGGHG
jgi:hypothetical protein